MLVGHGIVLHAVVKNTQLLAANQGQDLLSVDRRTYTIKGKQGGTSR
jgi:hypothetical protein